MPKFVFILVLSAVLACSLVAADAPTTPARVVYRPIDPNATPTRIPRPAPTPGYPEPAGCMHPPDDYTRVQVGYATLNQRTLWMLERAQELYGGTIPITGAGITQGSYNPGGVAASFGTHDGGGAVDLTVRNIPYDYDIKWEDIPRLIDALRLAGFAAFYRDERENLTPHIHAIAIGDAELSPAAAEQLTGTYGYFRGYDGFPREDGIPLTPRYGTVVICQWMLDMGYRDMRNEDPDLPNING
ncbi:MAG: hypothetical protein H6673_09245 [Anaerolineales bacterium]|nr:hypothetical protein [Anaerolineales bacterium]